MLCQPFWFITGRAAPNEQNIVSLLFQFILLLISNRQKKSRTKTDDALVARPNKHKNIIKSKTSKKLGKTHRQEKT